MAETTYGSRTRTRREEQGMTREALAAAAGTSVSTIARLELNDRLPSVATLQAIAHSLNVSVLFLLGEPEAVAS